MARIKTIKNMQEMADRHNGKCLSKKYIDAHTKLKWECEKGHIWWAIPNNIRGGSWCPYCSHKNKHTIEEMDKWAEENNGKCLSKKYINAFTKLKWKCNICNYEWWVTPSNIQQGKWCPCCAGNVEKTIEDTQKMADKHNGKCLSKKYVDAHTKLKWECEKGHIWWAVPSSIQQGSWCPYCAGRIRKTIKDMQIMADEHNGKCLSKKYKNDRTKLKWQCEYGHIWWAVPNSIRQGSWCPYCFCKSENKFREILEKLLKIKFPQKYPNWLRNPKTGYRLQLDGLNEKLGIAFEFQGYQHFKKAYYDTDDSFKERQVRDRLKKKLCKENNIILLCSTYELKEEEFEDFIRKELEGTDFEKLYKKED